MISKINHRNGLITEFEWCFGNYKDWFIEEPMKHKNEKGEILFSKVAAFLIFESENSKANNRSKPIIQIYSGPSYKNLKGLRVKVISPEPIVILELDIKRVRNSIFDDNYDSSHLGIKVQREIEIFGTINKVIYNIGKSGVAIYHIQNFQVLKKN